MTPDMSKLADELLDFPAIYPATCMIAVDHLDEGYCVIPSGLIRKAAEFLRSPALDERTVEKRDALYDSAYIAGVQKGFDLGLGQDEAELRKIIESRSGYLAALVRE